MLTNIFLILSSALITYLDLKYRKIFNMIAYPLMFAAVVLNICIFGPIGIIHSLFGFASGLLICYIPYKLNFSDLGEFKLFALIGILKGYYFVIIAGSLSCGFVLLSYILSLALSGEIKKIIQNSRAYLDLILEYGISISTIIDECMKKVIMPYSVVVFMVVLIWVGIGM